MAVKFSKYIFVKIRGKIVPIRKGLERASKSQNKLVDKLVKAEKTKKVKGLEKLGSGVDFTAFKNKNSNDYVIKLLKKWAGKKTKGTSNKYFNKRWPELKDKFAVHKALGDNLPNYGIPTYESEIIRIKKSERGVLQEFVSKKQMGEVKKSFGTQREAERIKRNSGLDIDAHYGNLDKHGRLVDTGGNLMKSRVRDIDDTAKELLGIDTYYGTEVKDLYKKSTVISDEAILSGQSKKALREINRLKKKGYKFKKSGKNEYKLVFHKNRKK